MNKTMTEWEWLNNFSDSLKSELEYAGMTQRDLADAAGLSEAAISSYIHKKKIPTVKSVVNICQVLGIYTDDLINFEKRIYQ